MSKEKLQGDEYEIIVCTPSDGVGNSEDQNFSDRFASSISSSDFKQKSRPKVIEMYKVKGIIIDGEKPIAYIKIGGYGIAIDKKSVEELIEALKTILKKK